MTAAGQYAVVFAEKEQARLQADPGPTPVAGNEVLGRTIVSLISPGTELACYRGQLTDGKFPMRPGYAAVFEVQEVGPEAQTLRPRAGGAGRLPDRPPPRRGRAHRRVVGAAQRRVRPRRAARGVP